MRMSDKNYNKKLVSIDELEAIFLASEHSFRLIEIATNLKEPKLLTDLCIFYETMASVLMDIRKQKTGH